MVSTTANDPTPGDCLLPLPPPPRRDKESEGNDGHRRSQRSPSFPTAPRQPQAAPGRTPCPAMPRTGSHPSCPVPGQQASPTHPSLVSYLLVLLGTVLPQEPQHTGHLRGQACREKGLVTAAGATHSALASSLIPEEQAFAQRSCPVVRSLSSQSHRIGDSFPSHVP